MSIQLRNLWQSLQVRIMFGLGLTMFLIIGLSTLLYVDDFRKNYLEAIEWRSVTLAQSLHLDIQQRYTLFGSIADSRLILESAYLQCKKLYQANQHMHVAFVGIVDPQATFITHSQKERWQTTLNSKRLHSALQSHKVSTVLFDGQYHTLIPIITAQQKFIGAIDVGFPQEVVNEKIYNHIQRVLFLCFGLFICISFFIWILIKQVVTNPIDNLVSATSEIAEGQLNTEVPLATTHEFRTLSMSLMHMRDSIRSNIRRAERKNEQIKALIACSPVALFSLNIHGEVAIWTTSAQRLFGWHPDEVRGKALPSLVDEEKERFSVTCDAIYQGQIITGLELMQKKKYGELIHASLSLAPILDSDGTISGIMVALEDISPRIEKEQEHKEIHERYLQSQKLESIGRLAGGVAHDYNNTLGVILGYAELLKVEIGQDETRRKQIDQIITATKHSADITRQLLTFARKQTIAPKLLDFNHQVETMLKMLRRLIGEDVELQWLPEAQQLAVRMDNTQIDQILANLCINARDAMPDGGKITIETRAVEVDAAYCTSHPGARPGSFIKLSISDTGIGMHKDVQEKIFEPFFTTKSSGEGTGLGLATVYGIIKQNNGFIHVYSEPGQGAVFSVYLPRYQGQGKKEAQPEAPKISSWLGNGERVLVVEDEASILTLCITLLEGLGYKVIAAEHPAKALELLAGQQGQTLDLLLTDVILPEMNGRELSEHIREQFPDIPTLYMSGYTANVIAQHGVLEEHEHFLAKPFSRQELAEKIHNIFIQGKQKEPTPPILTAK